MTVHAARRKGRAARPFSAHLADRYDLGWMEAGSLQVRLYRGLGLLRSVVAVVYPGRVRLDWASVDCPYQGLMVQADPIRILVDPKPLLRPSPSRLPLIFDALQGVAIHEAAHARYTPRDWSALLQAALDGHERRTGERLPRALVLPILNWAEDLYVEGEVVRSFPGFAGYLEQTLSYFLPPRRCGQAVRALRTALSDLVGQVGRPGAGAAIIQTAVQAVAVAVHYPGRYDARLADLLPAVVGVAETIRRAGGEAEGADRIAIALEAVAQLFACFRELLPSADHGAEGGARDGGAESGPDDAALREAIDRALAARTPLRRDDDLPFGTRAATARLTAATARALAHLELGAEEHLPAAAVSAKPLPDSLVVRILDAHPETLPDLPPGLESLARDLLAAYGGLATHLRRQLQVRALQDPRTVTGLRQGTLDERRLALVATGERAVYLRREQVEARGLDLVILVDESGSMRHEDRWRLAAAACVCVASALRDRPRSRLRVYGFTGDARETSVFRRYDSATPCLRRIEALGYCYPKGTTPTPLALATLRALLHRDAQPGPRPLILLISDGLPQVPGCSTEQVVALTGTEVRRLQAEGYRFAALQIGACDQARLQTMYGRHWQAIARAEDIPRAVAMAASQAMKTAR